MSEFSIACTSLFDGEKFVKHPRVLIQNGKISRIETDWQPSVDSQSEVSESGMLVAGFIDVQVNGGGNFLFNDSPQVDALIAIGKAHQQFGTTGWLPTLVTDTFSTMQLAADAVASARAQNVAGILGIHFEGPHLSSEKKGVHKAELMRDISAQELALFTRKDLGKVVVTLAPESVSCDSISELVAAGVIVCLGHSNATYEQAQAALAAGATGFTHLYNAMSPLTSRAAGMVGAALADQESWCGLIVDGVHVSAGAAQVALNAKQKMMLVTDAMPLVGSNENEFKLYGLPVKRVGDQLLDQHGRLAGSILNMANAVNNCQTLLQCSAERAFNMASLNPATFLGLDLQLGSLQPGKLASMVLLDEQGKVKATWIDGVQVFSLTEYQQE